MIPLRQLALYDVRAALLIFVLLPFLLIVAVSGGYSLHRLEQAARTSMEHEIELIARAIRLPLSHALQHGHQATLKRTVTSLFDVDKVYAVYVYDKDGKRISTTGSSRARVRGRDALDIVAEGDERGGFDNVDGVQLYSYFLPLNDNAGSSIGLLQVTRRGSDFSRHIDQFRSRALGLLVVTTLLVIALVWAGYQRAVGGHIQRMRGAMQRIAAGDLNDRVAAEGPAELRYLAQGINNMLDSIVASEQELAARRQRESELQKRLQQSEKLAAIGRFAAGVAHELGAPLSVADGKVQRALRRDNDPTGVLPDIRQQLQRMERIIRQLMDFTRPVTPSRDRVKAQELVRSSLTQVEPERQHLHVTIQQLPPSEPVSPVFGNRLRLEQALINLLRNAIQATPQGLVQICWWSEEDCLVLAVDDDGPGVADEDKPHLLEPFYTTKALGAGTGLGLAVVNAVVTEHGGRVEVTRSDIGGASFRLYLPIFLEEVQDNDK